MSESRQRIAVALRAMAAALSLALSVGSPARSCAVKLLLTWDVSPSMSVDDYRLQRRGTARALLDRDVLNSILVMEGGMAVSIMQWAGPGEQEVSIPWTMLEDEGDIAGLARAVETLRDPFGSFLGTAVGDSLRAARRHLEDGPDCARSVMDVSADGGANTGLPAGPEADALAVAGVAVNALVLPASPMAILAEGDPYLFYVHEVARAPGAFVMDVASYDDYWRALRRKLLRELPVYVARN